ncbi:MAG: hypothetical protein LBN94_02200 [Puniceicoccales bacterium]|jgi:hypothetical protein|nr:hypothetical protein [Puniceicoccales bacterium]
MWMHGEWFGSHSILGTVWSEESWQIFCQTLAESPLSLWIAFLLLLLLSFLYRRKCRGLLRINGTDRGFIFLKRKILKNIVKDICKQLIPECKPYVTIGTSHRKINLWIRLSCPRLMRTLCVKLQQEITRILQEEVGIGNLGSLHIVVGKILTKGEKNNSDLLCCPAPNVTSECECGIPECGTSASIPFEDTLSFEDDETENEMEEEIEIDDETEDEIGEKINEAVAKEIAEEIGKEFSSGNNGDTAHDSLYNYTSPSDEKEILEEKESDHNSTYSDSRYSSPYAHSSDGTENPEKEVTSESKDIGNNIWDNKNSTYNSSTYNNSTYSSFYPNGGIGSAYEPKKETSFWEKNNKND